MQPGGDPKLRILMEKAAKVAAQALGTGGSPQDISTMTEILGDLLDKEIVHIQARRQDKLACKEGCDHCCHNVVMASIPEVVRVVEFIDENFTDEQKETLSRAAAKAGLGLSSWLLAVGLRSAQTDRPAVD